MMTKNLLKHIAVIQMILLALSPVACLNSSKKVDQVSEKDQVGQIAPAEGLKKTMDRSSGYGAPAPTRAQGSVAPHQLARPPFNTENYDKINENIFLSAMQNPLSTFSVDVDRASYGNVRRFLMDNKMPPPDAVRIEELVNYFDYDYPQPTSEHPFSVNLEAAQAPWNSKHTLVMVGLKGKEVDVANIPPSNLVFLLDVSGSMQDENKLPLLKQSFRFLIQKLRPQDRVAIVTYAGAAGLVLPSTKGSDKNKIIAALDNLTAGGSTAGGEGVQLAYKIAKENFVKGGNNRVVLATDGDFNVGISSEGDLQRLIEKERETGVFLTILGFGMGNYQDAKIKTLSNAGNGNYSYIDNIVEAQKVLGKEMWGTIFTIAKDVKLQVEFNPAQVKAYRLIGYEDRMLKSEDFNNDKKDAGDIGSGHTVTAFYEIIPAGSDEKVPNVDELTYQKNQVVPSGDLMTVKLRYKQPAGKESVLMTQSVTKEEIRTENISNNFKFASAVVEFGMLLRNSEFKGSSSYKDVIASAEESIGKDADGYRAEFLGLVKTAKGLVK